MIFYYPIKKGFPSSLYLFYLLIFFDTKKKILRRFWRKYIWILYCLWIAQFSSFGSFYKKYVTKICETKIWKINLKKKISPNFLWDWKSWKHSFLQRSLKGLSMLFISDIKGMMDMWNKRKGNKKEIYINWFVVLSEKWKHVFTLLLHTTSGLMVTTYGVF